MATLRENTANLRRRMLIAAALHLGVLVVLIGMMSITVLETARRLRMHSSAGTIVLFIVVIVIDGILLWHFARALWVYVTDRPRIVPYYTKQPGNVRPASDASRAAFHGGVRLAAGLSRVDEVARQRGLKPLSAFGFDDDVLGQRPQWHDPAEGLRTVAAIIDSLPESDSATADLRAIRDALADAVAGRVSFCLILRYGADDFISGHEMERREGTFWC